MENVSSGAAAAMSVALKMKNLFNNACTFRNKSYAIFSVCECFFFFICSFRLSYVHRTGYVCNVYHGIRYVVLYYLVERSIGSANARTHSPPDDPLFTPTQNFAYPSIAIYCRHSPFSISSFGLSSHAYMRTPCTLAIMYKYVYVYTYVRRTWSRHCTHYTLHTHRWRAVQRSERWLSFRFGWLHTVQPTVFVRPCYVQQKMYIHVWEKFSIYHRRTDKLYRDENGSESES